MSDVTEHVIVPSSPEDRKRIKDAMQEVSNAMTRIESERDFIKDVIAKVKEDFHLPPKYFRKLCKVYHKQSFNAELAEHDEFTELYEVVTGIKKDEDNLPDDHEVN